MIRPLGYLLLAGVLAADPFATEYDKAAGSWRVTAMEMNGETVAPEGFKGMRLVLKGDTLKALSDKGVIAEGTYKIVGVKGKLVQFDLRMSAGPDKGKTFPALNEWLDADTIRTCISQPDKPRPTNFQPEKGDRRALFTIKRAKK
jgi:uncharacterized protein (TIGR03067 family)